MVTPGTPPLAETPAPVHRRPPALLLPEDPSADDLVRYWTLSARDHAEVLRCRGNANRRRFAVPARSTLDALVVSVTARIQDALHTRIATHTPPALQRALDDLLGVPDGARRSMLFQLKEYPPEASPAVLLRYIERYHFLHA